MYIVSWVKYVFELCLCQKPTFRSLWLWAVQFFGFLSGYMISRASFLVRLTFCGSRSTAVPLSLIHVRFGVKVSRLVSSDTSGNWHFFDVVGVLCYFLANLPPGPLAPVPLVVLYFWNVLIGLLMKIVQNHGSFVQLIETKSYHSFRPFGRLFHWQMIGATAFFTECANMQGFWFRCKSKSWLHLFVYLILSGYPILY